MVQYARDVHHRAGTRHRRSLAGRSARPARRSLLRRGPRRRRRARLGARPPSDRGAPGESRGAARIPQRHLRSSLSNWPAANARRVLAALLRRGWVIKRQSGSHRTLSHADWPDFVFAFHDDPRHRTTMSSSIVLGNGLDRERGPSTRAFGARSGHSPCQKRGLPRASRAAASRVVRKGGFEPPRSCERQPLKLVRLPVPPLSRGGWACRSG